MRLNFVIIFNCTVIKSKDAVEILDLIIMPTFIYIATKLTLDQILFSKNHALL